MLLELLKKTRTYRRFDRFKFITDNDLAALVESAGYVPSAGNLQRIRYITVGAKAALNLFSHISLGGYLPKEKKPDISVAPVAYIVMLTESDMPDINLSIDVGISAEAIVLSAAEKGIGACMVRNFDKDYFSSLVGDSGYSPVLVIALGYPDEEVKIIKAGVSDSLKYFKDENGVNVVPKLPVESLILKSIE